MLCKATYTGFGGGSTDLYYSGGHLARLVNPGGEITDFGYDATGALTQVRDPRTNDLIYANVIADGAADTHKTLIAYSGGKVTSVRGPVASAAMTDAQRAQHTYEYPAGSTKVHVTGLSEPNGYSRQVDLDAFGHATADRDPAGIAVNHTWDTFNDRVTKSVDHHYQPDPAGGLVTTSVYDAAGRPTDSYGPGPASEFAGQPPTAPRSTTGYDEGITGLAAAWFANRDFAATPVRHTTSAANDDPLVPGAGVPVDNFSGRLTGEVKLPAAGTLTLNADGGRVFVDDAKLIDTWGGPYRAAVTADRPEGSWRLGDAPAAARAVDATGGPAATYQGGVTPGVAGALSADGDTAASFNGVDGRVALPRGFDDFRGGLTMEAWVKPTGNGNFERIFDLGNGPAADNVILPLGHLQRPHRVRAPGRRGAVDHRPRRPGGQRVAAPGRHHHAGRPGHHLPQRRGRGLRGGAGAGGGDPHLELHRALQLGRRRLLRRPDRRGGHLLDGPGAGPHRRACGRRRPRRVGGHQRHGGSRDAPHPGGLPRAHRQRIAAPDLLGAGDDPRPPLRARNVACRPRRAAHHHRVRRRPSGPPARPGHR